MIATIIFGLLAGTFAAISAELYKRNQAYRQRIFELTGGKECSNLVVVVPDTPAPTPPVKPSVEQRLANTPESDLADKLLGKMDWGRIEAIDTLINGSKSSDDLRKSARRAVLYALDHRDREWWWAHCAPFYATIDKKNGLHLRYNPFWKRLTPKVIYPDEQE